MEILFATRKDNLGSTKMTTKPARVTNAFMTRRFYSVGEFSVTVPVEDFPSDANLVIFWGRGNGGNAGDATEVGLIQKVDFTSENNMLTLSGFFAEDILSGVVFDAIRAPLTNYTSIRYIAKKPTTSEFVKEMFDFWRVDEKRKCTFYDAYNGEKLGNETTSNFVACEMRDKLYSILAERNLSFRISLPLLFGVEDSDSLWNWSFIKPRDLTETVVFGSELGNLSKFSYSADKSAAYDAIFVFKTGDQTIRFWSKGDYTSQYLDIDLIYSDKTKKAFPRIDESYNPSDTERQMGLENLELADAKEDMSGRVPTVDIDAEGAADDRYLKDYTIGDIVTVINPITNLHESRQIVEVSEVFKNGAQFVTLKFGTRQFSRLERAINRA